MKRGLGEVVEPMSVHLSKMKVLWVLIAGFVVVSAQSCSKSKKCKTFACCSQWGHCGFGPDYCEKGCQNDCDAKPDCGKYAKNFDCPLKVCCSKWGYCGTTEDFCKKECQGNCEKPPQPSCGNTSRRPQVYIGYYASWASTRRCNQYGVENIDARNYTHLNYAFVDVRQGVIAPLSAEEDANLRAFSALKQDNPNLQVLASVGGWAFNDPGETQQEFHNIAASSSARRKFIDSVENFLIEYDFDGIDIDWEYPVADDRGGSPEDKENYLQLVKEMREAYGYQYLITIAAPASYWYLRHFDIGKMSEHLDWINVMTYDIHGVWDADIKELGPYVNPHTSIAEIEPAIGLFTKDGVPHEKLVLGTGFYGRAFTLESSSCTEIGCNFTGPAKAGRCTDAPGTLAWFEIEEIIREQGVSPVFDEKSMSKYLVFDQDQWVGYDDEETLFFRRKWAQKNCMFGTMIWSIDQGLDKYISNEIEKRPPRPIKRHQYGTQGSGHRE